MPRLGKDRKDCLLPTGERALARVEAYLNHSRPHLESGHDEGELFAIVKLGTAKTRNCLARTSMLTMVFKLCLAAEKNWRRLQGYKLIADVIRDVRFINGIREDRIAA